MNKKAAEGGWKLRHTHVKKLLVSFSEFKYLLSRLSPGGNSPSEVVYAMRLELAILLLKQIRETERLHYKGRIEWKVSEKDLVGDKEVLRGPPLQDFQLVVIKSRGMQACAGRFWHLVTSAKLYTRDCCC